MCWHVGKCDTIDSHKCRDPDDKSIKWHNNVVCGYCSRPSGWWSKSGYNSDSNEIVLDLPNKHYCFDPTESYRIWYAEDDFDQSEHDNHGTAKTDVYVELACPAGDHSLDGKGACIGTLVDMQCYCS